MSIHLFCPLTDQPICVKKGKPKSVLCHNRTSGIDRSQALVNQLADIFSAFEDCNLI